MTGVAAHLDYTDNRQFATFYPQDQALEDGVLVDASEMASEAGIEYPVFLTEGAWRDCVSWDDPDSERKAVPDDEDNRLWSVVWMLRCALQNQAARRGSEPEFLFTVYRIPREGFAWRPQPVTLKAIRGANDAGEQVMMVSLPDED
jgi:hypothetical protein